MCGLCGLCGLAGLAGLGFDLRWLVLVSRALAFYPCLSQMLSDPEYGDMKESVSVVAGPGAKNDNISAKTKFSITGPLVRTVVEAHEQSKNEQAATTYGRTVAEQLRVLAYEHPTRYLVFMAVLDLYKRPEVQAGDTTGWAMPGGVCNIEWIPFVLDTCGWFSKSSITAVTPRFSLTELVAFVEGAGPKGGVSKTERREARAGGKDVGGELLEMMEQQEEEQGKHNRSKAKSGRAARAKPKSRAKPEGNAAADDEGAKAANEDEKNANADGNVLYFFTKSNKYCVKACNKNPGTAGSTCMAGECACLLSMIVSMTRPLAQGGIGLVLPDTSMPARGAAADEARRKADHDREQTDAADEARRQADHDREQTDAKQQIHIHSGGSSEAGDDTFQAMLIEEKQASGPPEPSAGRKRKAPDDAPAPVVLPVVKLEAADFTGATSLPIPVRISRDFKKSHLVRAMAVLLEQMQMCFVRTVYQQGVTSFHPEAVQLESIPQDGQSKAKTRAAEHRKGKVASDKAAAVNYGVFPSHVLRVPVLAQYMLDNCSPSHSYGWQEFKRKPPPGFTATRPEFKRFCRVFMPAPAAPVDPAPVDPVPVDPAAPVDSVYPGLGYFGDMVFPTDRKPTSMTYIVAIRHTETSRVLGNPDCEWLDSDALGNSIFIDAHTHVWHPKSTVGLDSREKWMKAFTEFQEGCLSYVGKGDDNHSIAHIDWMRGTYKANADKAANKITSTAAMINHSESDPNCVSLYPHFELYTPVELHDTLLEQAQQFFEFSSDDHPDFFLLVVPAKPDLLRTVGVIS